MSYIGKFPWFRRALIAVAFIGTAILALGAATPAQAYWYYPYYGYPYYYSYPYYSAYYPYYYGYPVRPFVRVGWGWGWRGGWHGGWRGGWHHH
jgi:hypothetical protein